MINDTTTAHGYLAEIREAVAELPYRVAADIVAGIEEELEGLDDAQVAQRIAQLGKPSVIAASAHQELGATPAVTEPKRQDAAWYTLTAAIALLLGGVVIPMAGWLLGLVLLWASRTWTLRDKLIGTLAPPLGAYWTLAVFTFSAFSPFTQGGEPNPFTVELPLVTLIAVWVAAVLPFATFAYLLVRARRLKARR